MATSSHCSIFATSVIPLIIKSYLLSPLLGAINNSFNFLKHVLYHILQNVAKIKGKIMILEKHNLGFLKWVGMATYILTLSTIFCGLISLGGLRPPTYSTNSM